LKRAIVKKRLPAVLYRRDQLAEAFSGLKKSCSVPVKKIKLKIRKTVDFCRKL
jgi:hypothetical protein